MPLSDGPREHTATWSGGEPPEVAGVPALGGRFEVARRLGGGGQAEVWLARDREIDQWVAVKVFRPGMSEAARERLRREVRLGRSLQHERLVRMYELVEAGPAPALVAEWVEGGSVADRLRAGPLELAEALRIAEECLEALAYLHARGVVHRDVKPANLLLDRDGRVKLGDLGLARLVEPGDTVTVDAATLGTPRYMSPEQVKGLPATPASDLYALGVTLFELVTGEPVFAATEGLDTAMAHLRERPRSPTSLRPDCPRWVARFALRLLEKRPGDRFADGASALAAFRRRRVAASPRVWRRLGAGLAAAVALAAAAALLAARTRLPATTTVIGNGVAVQDDRGRELWRRELPSPPLALVADVVGDDRPEVVVGVPSNGREAGAATPELTVLDFRGADIARASLELPGLRNVHQRVEPRGFIRLLGSARTSPEGPADLTWIVLHPSLAPSELGSWRIRSGAQPRTLLTNSGHLHRMVARDLDGDGADELVVWGINNPIGYQQVVAVLEVPPDAGDLAAVQSVSPDAAEAWLTAASTGQRSLPVYLPVGPFAGLMELTLGAGLVFDSAAARVELDAAGNPLDSPLAGRGTEPRTAFWTGLARACVAVENGDPGATGLASFEREHADVLVERPSRLAAELLLARSLARAGRHADAAGRLQAAVADDHESPDLWLRLGEQAFLAGDRLQAAAALREGSIRRPWGRGPQEAALALGLVGLLAGDRDLLTEALQRWSSWQAPGSPDGVSAEILALAAFADGDWRSPLLKGASPTPEAPSLPVARAWAATARGDAPVELEALLANPETRPFARVLAVERDLTEGRPADAEGTLREAIRELEFAARTSLEARLWLALAEDVSGRVAAARGDADAAEAAFRRAAELAPGCRFGRPAQAPGTQGWTRATVRCAPSRARTASSRE